MPATYQRCMNALPECSHDPSNDSSKSLVNNSVECSVTEHQLQSRCRKDDILVLDFPVIDSGYPGSFTKPRWVSIHAVILEEPRQSDGNNSSNGLFLPPTEGAELCFVLQPMVEKLV